MATRARLGGIASFTVNGVPWNLVSDLVYSASSVERTTALGQDGIHGWTEAYTPNWLEGTFRDAGGLSVAQINTLTGANPNALLANGKQIVGTNMWTTSANEVDTTNGTFKARFEGDETSVQEILTSVSVTQ